MAKRQREDETPVGFHVKRGRYVQLSPDNLTAKRDGNTYDNGVCFTQKPLKIGDVFQLRIEEMDLKWAGSLRLGVTTINPDSNTLNVARAATDLFNNNDVTDFWILSGTRLHHGIKENEYSLNLHNLKVDSRIGMQVTQNGKLVYYVDGVSMGAAACDIPIKKPVYGIFDIYGRTKVISKELFEVDSLENLCTNTIIKHVKEDDIEKLVLPLSLKSFLKQAKNKYPYRSL